MRFNIVTDSNTATLAVFRPVTWNTEVKVYSWGEYGDATTTGPCGGCGMEVTVVEGLGQYARRLHLFCSERGRARHYNCLRSQQSVFSREKVCEVCQESFTATRRDAKTCSAACKQKAYRLRQRKGLGR